eukprot:5721288-Pyramimonas_sp.AAC.1
MGRSGGAITATDGRARAARVSARARGEAGRIQCEKVVMLVGEICGCDDLNQRWPTASQGNMDSCAYCARFTAQNFPRACALRVWHRQRRRSLVLDLKLK